MTEKIGIMGGTFDPIHNGHIAIAHSAASQLGLRRVLFIPTGNPHFKLDKRVTDAHIRAHMVELAIADEKGFELERCEIERPGVTYTADTLEELTSRNANAEFFFIMGTDTAATLCHWRRAQRVAELCRIALVQRPGKDARELRQTLLGSPLGFKCVFVDAPQVDVSSTYIRACVSRGESIEGLTPDPVREYIEQHGLYKE